MKGKLFYPGEDVVAVNKSTNPLGENANKASDLIFNKSYTIEMYWRFSDGHWWLSVFGISDAVYTEDEFASMISLKDKFQNVEAILK
jgi:hypothetical protein